MNTSLLILGVVILLSTLLFGLIFIYFRNANPAVNKVRRNHKRTFTATTQPRKSKISQGFKASNPSDEKVLRREQATQQLQKRVLLLLNGDRNTANRLLNSVKSRNPQKSVEWCVEKVIFDLQRDRSGY